MDERKAKFLELYLTGSTFEEAVEEVGGDENEANGWLVDDEDFAKKFERAIQIKEIRIRQKAIDQMEKVAESMAELAKSGKASSVSAARFVRELMQAPTREKADEVDNWKPPADTDPADYEDEIDRIAKEIR